MRCIVAQIKWHHFIGTLLNSAIFNNIKQVKQVAISKEY